MIENPEETILDLKRHIKKLPELRNPMISQIELFTLEDVSQTLQNEISLKTLKMHDSLGSVIVDINIQNLTPIQRDVLDMIENVQDNGVFVALNPSEEQIEFVAEIMMNENNESSLPLLKGIDINQCRTSLMEIFEALKRNKSVLHLSLRFIEFLKEDFLYLVDVLKINNTIKTVSLVGCSIGSGEAVDLAGALISNTSIETLSLSFNKIGGLGMVSLANALKINTSIKVLVIQNNLIGDIGAFALADALIVNRSLIYVSLEKNQIGNEGALKLSESLKINDTLKKIDFSYNFIGDKGTFDRKDRTNQLKVNNISMEMYNLFENFSYYNGELTRKL